MQSYVEIEELEAGSWRRRSERIGGERGADGRGKLGAQTARRRPRRRGAAAQPQAEEGGDRGAGVSFGAG